MQYSIKDITQSHQENEWPISSEGLLCGRSHTAVVIFTEPDVSGLHVFFGLNGDGEPYLENMSVRKTLLNDAPLKHGAKVNIKAGDTVQLGETVRLQLVSFGENTVTDAATTTVSGEETLYAGETMVDLHKDETIVKDDVYNATLIRGMEGGTAQNETEADVEAEGTRMVSAEELRKIREAQKGGMGKRVFLWCIILVILGLIAVGAWKLSSVKQETYLSWPVDRNGKYNDAIVYPNGELGNNFEIYYPKTNGMTETKTDDGFIVETRLGKMKDVPFRLIYSEHKDVANLALRRKEGFETWMRNIQQKESGWNFDSMSDIEFRGKNNGLPYQYARYSRTDGAKSWFGVVIYFKYKDYEIVFCKEIPSQERWRGEDLLVGDTCMYASPDFIERHWEFQGELVDLPIQKLLAESRNMLNRISPAMWRQIKILLVSAMIKAQKSGDLQSYETAEGMLRELRQTQTHWLNSQKLAYFNAQAKNLYKQAIRIRDDCRAMFSDENDQRYHFIRQDQWD